MIHVNGKEVRQYLFKIEGSNSGIVAWNNDGSEDLYSYGYKVASRDPSGKVHVVPGFEHYSKTTTKHINAFKKRQYDFWSESEKG